MGGFLILSLWLITVCLMSIEVHMDPFDPLKSYIEIDTEDDGDFVNLEQYGVEVDCLQKIFRFKVRATASAHVFLLRNAGDTAVHDQYEIVIGANGNSRSIVRKCSSSGTLAECKHTPLDPSVYVDFWICWIDGVITVGMDTVIGVRQFLKYKDPYPKPVTFIVIATKQGSTGMWRFEHHMKRPTIGFTTGVDHVYCHTGVHGRPYEYRLVPELTFSARYRESFFFYVMAEEDAYIALQSDVLNYKDIYEIIIGKNNQKSVIKKSKDRGSATHALHRPLSAEQHIPFWISFGDGIISVGHGCIIGYRRFMYYVDKNPLPINYISVKVGYGTTGHWLFHPRSWLYIGHEQTGLPYALPYNRHIGHEAEADPEPERQKENLKREETSENSLRELVDRFLKGKMSDQAGD